MLALVVLLMVACLEFRHPYFFFQDDNRTSYLPLLVHNLRSLAGGELPFFNFHQSLGTPTAIHYGSFYPLNYLALGLSNLVSGGWFMTLDILAAIHLVIAAIGFFLLMRHFQVTPSSAFFGAIGWSFCSFVITVGNSWSHVIGYAAWLPWICTFSLRQLHGITSADFLTLTLLRLMPLLLGNPQFFVYTATFDLLLLLGCSVAEPHQERSSRSKVGEIRLFCAVCGSYLLVLLLSLPLVMQSFHLAASSVGRKEVLSWEAYSALSYEVSHWFNGLIAPFHDMPVNTWVEQQFLSHIGYLSLIFIVFAAFKTVENRHRRHVILLLLLALFSFLWAADLGPTTIFYYLPVYNKFRFPFKLAFFTGFFLLMVATLGFDLFMARRGRFLAILLVALHAGNFLALYTLLPQRMFTKIEDPVPFDEPLKKVLADGRIVTGWLDPVVVHDKGFPGMTVPTIGYDYATLWGLNYFGGYDPFLSEKNFHASLGRLNRGDFNVEKGKPLDVAKDVPVAHFRIWGVKWYIFEKSIPLINTGDLVNTPYGDSTRTVLYDPGAMPLVYWRNDVKKGGVRQRFTTNTVQIQTDSPSGGALIVNVLHHPFFTAVLDGTRTSLTETEEGQMLLSVPPGRHTVLVRYVDPYFVRYGWVSVATALSLISWYILSARHRRLKEPHHG